MLPQVNTISILDFVLDEIRKERERQDAKHGTQLDVSNHVFLSILLEEIGEAAMEMNDHTTDNDNFLLEVIQIAAVATKWAEAIYTKRQREHLKNVLMVDVDKYSEGA